MRVERGRLVPSGQYDAERLDSYRIGSTVMVRFTADRMRPLERKYRAILGKVVKECKTPWTNAEAAHQAIKLACGIVNVSKTAGGQFFQYPRSLVDLDDKEMEEYFNDAMALLERLTGVDVETLKRETAHVDAEDDEIIDPQTGEITNPGKDTPSSDAGDDDASPSVQASSTEPEDSAKSSADTGSNEESAVSPSPNTPALAAGSSSPIPEKEIIVLRRFAKDVLNMAAKPETSGELMSKVIRRWSNMELVGLSPEGKEAAKSIHASVKAIMENSTSVESAIEFYSEALGCEPAELTVNDNG
jgi:hypothetical protein